MVGSNSNWKHTLLIYRVKCVNWQQNSNEIYTFRLFNICGIQNRVESSKAYSNRVQFRQPAVQFTNALHNMRYTGTDILILFIYLLLYNSISSTIQTSSFRLGRRATGRISHSMEYMYMYKCNVINAKYRLKIIPCKIRAYSVRKWWYWYTLPAFNGHNSTRCWSVTFAARHRLVLFAENKFRLRVWRLRLELEEIEAIIPIAADKQMVVI